MLNKKEIIAILTATLILAFAINLLETWKSFLYTILAVLLLLLLNIAAKKITAFYLDSEVEIKIWEFKRFGFKKHQRLRKSFPAGVFFPVISKIILFPISNFVWMASLVFDVKAKTYRAARRHGLYSFSEMTEDHIGFIAAAGIFTNLVLAVAGYLIGFPLFAKLNIYYAFFNMIPISDLDGNKIFFGSSVLWSFLAAIALIGMGYAILMP